MNKDEAIKRSEKALKFGIRTALMMALLGLHELSHPESAGYVAVVVSGFCTLGCVAVLLEPWIMRLIGRRHARKGWLDEILYENPWYREAYEKERK